MVRDKDRKGVPKGLVFDIQKFSLHDGPGIRTVVFLKGCPLSCLWCSNPEGQGKAPELVYRRDRCIGTAQCGQCMEICLEQAIEVDPSGAVFIDRDRCNGCGDCSHVCPSQALEVSGRWVSVQEVLAIVEEDDAFYARSGGGLTLSGGEPLAQGAFSLALLRAARARGIDTAIETTGLCNWKTLREAASLADRIFFDIKCLASERHQRVTGVSNQPIVDNFRRLRDAFPDLETVVRTPIVPGVNDSEDEIQAIRGFVQRTGRGCRYELLPYHGFGGPKYATLGKRYTLTHLRPPSAARMQALQRVATLPHC
ncbi:MAG: pyruvate formate lyase-activating protein [Myxococcales bacterium SG8_38]|nr:MAG: pyruvate formate lyase-activating protein [Myxococcales bacterium SG8_38]